MGIEQEILSNFLTRFKAKIKPSTMTELEMHAQIKNPAIDFVLKVEKSAAAKRQSGTRRKRNYQSTLNLIVIART
jgi:hypothetical protein